MTTINEIEMLPCAHCGRQDIRNFVDNSLRPNRNIFKVFCNGCGISTKHYSTLGQAIEAWNKRTPLSMTVTPGPQEEK